MPEKKKRKAVRSNDVEEETEVQEELDNYQDDSEEEDPNYDPSDKECYDLDQLLDDTVEVDNTLHVEYGPESSNVACAAAEDEVNLVIGKFNNFLVLTL